MDQMDLRQAIIITTQVQSAFATINHIFNINGQKENTNLIEVDGCLCPSVSDDFILYCEESDLCEYLARMAVERLSDEFDLEFFENFVFGNIDRTIFEEAEKCIISHLNLSAEEVEAAPALIKRFI